MSRPVTLFTGQWADLLLTELAPKAKDFGYDGLELACWGDHFDVEQAAKSVEYAQGRRALLEKNGLGVWSISTHLVGQMVCDMNDFRTDGFAPPELAGKPEEKRAWAIEFVKKTAKAAKNMGVEVVNGFTGSSIWHLLYAFPPYDFKVIDQGYQFFADKWNPILDEFKKQGVRFALEVHPTEIAFDIITAKRALDALDNRPEFGFNFDPSHLVWQGVDPVRFLEEFSDRIYHVHVKDAAVTLDGYSGILASHLNFGEAHRGWDFRSPGHGDVDFESIIRQLNRIGYTGPLSVEWEDSGMDREYGARDAAEFVRRSDFGASNLAFDAAFSK
ncbi:MAG: sugar phosphate isomerase/epimerase [Chloroflexi bacterium]|nr:sugar phosphate isomerase/epimerase [Chloroflexota bacterium]